MSGSDQQKCRLAAMNLLSRREHSRFELERKLAQRGFDEQVLTMVLTALSEENLLSDERFTESYVHGRIQRGYGPKRLAQELREHHIDEALIEQSLVDQPWTELAREARHKRFGLQLPEDYKEQAKQMRFLQYRGFSFEQINSVMKQEQD